MNKKKKLIFIFLISILFIFKLSLSVSARSGGGGHSSGGSHSSSGGGYSSSIHRSGGTSFGGGYGSRESQIYNAIQILIVPLFIILIWKKQVMINKVKISRKSRDTEKVISRLEKIDNSYSKDMLEKRVQETYFKMQRAWTSFNLEISKEYMSEDIYELHKSKLAWMKMRDERNVLKNIKLISAKPVGVQHYKDNSKDIVWFCIQGEMIDYIINKKSKQVIDGRTVNSSFIEYWKFIKKNNSWVVDLIMQEKEIYIDRDFIIASEE
ncbi:Tim44 domain-containing protein [Clostridium botulinum]|nr:Tim44 domain-containing protein [Clostridium botulinum]